MLATALAEGAWPKLQRLFFDRVKWGREGFQVVLNGLVTRLKTQAKPLQGLGFFDVGLTDEYVGDLANAMRQERLSSDMRKLILSDNDLITDRGALRLAAALGEGRAPLLSLLSFKGTEVTAAGIGAVVYAVLRGCLALSNLCVPYEIEESDMNVLRGIIASVEPKVAFFLDQY